MASKIFICVLLFAVLGCSLAKLHKGKGKGSYGKIKKGYKTKPIPEEPVDLLPQVPVLPCEGVFCGAGRVCVVTEEQEPSCQCAEGCEPHDHQVCGSDGVTYPNKCELHRAACLQEAKITQVKVGACKVAPTPAQTRSPPVVCYQTDRNVLQKQLVQWIQSQEMDAGWFQSSKKYLDVVDEYFQIFDESRDELIDNAEFMKFVEHNETVRNSTSQDENTEGDNQLMRSMCVDALVAEVDQDFDWRLNKEEFESCLSPEFLPGTKLCSLESREYADGEVVPNRCNECVCACGNWVCTANACDGDMVAGTDAQEEYDPLEENAMNEKEWTAIMKKLAKINPGQFPDHVRDLKHLNEKINAAPEAPETMEEIIEEEEEEFEQLLEEEEAMEFEEEIAEIEEQAAPVAPVMIDEVPMPVEEEIPEQPRVVERVRTGKRGGRPPKSGKHKGDRHRGGKRGHKHGGRKN